MPLQDNCILDYCIAGIFHWVQIFAIFGNYDLKSTKSEQGRKL